MRGIEISRENPEIKEEKKGMSAQELLDELKKRKESGIKKAQLIFKSGPSKEPVNLECMDLNKAKIKGEEILICEAEITKKTTVKVNFYAPLVIGIKEWIASGQANDVCWNRGIEEVKKNRTIGDEEFAKHKKTTDVITGNAKGGIGANDAGLNKELWKERRDNAAN